MSATQGYELSIDFGTSNTTAVARVAGRGVAVLFDGKPSMPSGVLLLDGRWHVGSRAAAQWRALPTAFEPAPKRRIDATSSVRLGGRDVAPVDLVAAVLAEVRRSAQRTTGLQEPDRVVLTHPIAWAPSQIAQLQAGARRAGFRGALDTSVSEPVAAARWYEANGALTGSGPVLVFDLGGGTCDVAVLAAGGSSARALLASDGDESLGGRDLDARLYRWVVEQIDAQGRNDVAGELRNPGSPSRLVLLDGVRGVKEDLTDRESAVLPVRVGGLDTAIVVQKSVYEGLITAEVTRAAELVRRVLDRAHVQPGTLGALHLTGGAAQTPAVIAAVQRAAGVAASPFEDVKLVVAEGALLAGRPLPHPADPSPREPVAEDLPSEAPSAPTRLSEQQIRDANALEEARRVAIADRKRRTRRVRNRIVGLAVGAVLGTTIGIAFPHHGAQGDPETPPVTRTQPVPTQDASTKTGSVDTTSDAVTRIPLTGAAALQWAYGDQDVALPMTCVRSTDPLDDPDLVTELTCTWADLPHTSMELYEFTSAAAANAWVRKRMHSLYPDAAPQSQILQGEATSVGTMYADRGTFDGTKWDDVVNVYGRLPFVSWISTDLSAGGTTADTTDAYESRLGFRTPDDIDQVLEDGYITG